MPILSHGQVLVRNHYSLISVGTESNTVKTARKSLIGKVKERPEQFKQVLETLNKIGPVQTYRSVMKKLDSYSSLGYSCAGEVVEIGNEVSGFKIGDKVACAGVGFANHAEFVAVPQNLCVKLSNNANMRDASYNTLGAIAMQAVRQADLRIGESCTVIGLGLLGQLACLILKASGVKVYGIDVQENAVKSAQRCTDKAWLRSTPNLTNQINEVTGGYGVDAVIIAAATTSLDPINYAGEITRKKGKVVILGAVPTGFDRDPFFYKKELDIRMSCSYGPGRYDFSYEEKGVDYPYAYVRWTEKRNMSAFQDLIESGRINLEHLTTHEFDFSEAVKSYDMILKNEVQYLGVILKYDVNKSTKKTAIAINEARLGEINIAFIGAGSYAQSHLLPNINANKGIILKGVLTNSGATSKRIAEKYKFEFCTSEKSDILRNKDINTVFIATRHDSHAKYVVEAMLNNKNVFVEKPLCLTKEELNEIKNRYNPEKQLMVGFNRRFSPLAIELKKRLTEFPISMIYRINAGYIPLDSWIHDSKVGGGRILGEVCHFIDLLTWFNSSLPKEIFATEMKTINSLNDILNISISFANGSIGTISYYSNGSKALSKELLEIYQLGNTYIIKDFKELEIFEKKQTKKRLLNQDKGQKNMVNQFLNSIKNNTACIPVTELFSVTETTFNIIESLEKNKVILV